MKQEHNVLCYSGLGEPCELLLGNLQKVTEKGKLFTFVTSCNLSVSLSLCEPEPTLETSSFHKMKRLTHSGQKLHIYYRLHMHKPHKN